MAPRTVTPPKLNFNPPKISTLAPTGGTKNIVITPPGVSDAGKKKPRSLWNQITDVASGIIPGIVNLTKTSIESSPLGQGVRAGARAKAGKAVEWSPWNPEYNPAGKQQADSLVRTGGDVIHPSRFVTAVNNGTIIDKLLEDTANISMIAAPAMKGFGMAATAAEGAGYAKTAAVLGGAEKAAQYAHSVLGPVADAPISVPRKLLTYAGEGTRGAVNALAGGEGMFSGAATRLRDLMPLTFDETGREINAGLKSEYGARTRAKARVGRDLFTKGGLIDKELADRPTLAEQGAATAIMSGLGHADQMLRNTYGSDTAPRTITHLRPPELADQVSGQFFHGSSSGIQQFGDYGSRSAENLFGPGVYTTDTPSVASTYTRKGGRGDPSVYRVEGPAAPKAMDLRVPQPDMNDAIRRHLPTGDWFDPPVEDLDALHKVLDDPSASADQVYSQFRKTVASAGLPLGEADEILTDISDHLRTDKGYDALTHTGGVRTGNQQHEVTIWLNPEDVRIAENVTQRTRPTETHTTVPGRPGLTPEQIRLAHVTQDIPEQTFTPDIADVTRKYIDGTLDPESHARVERVMAANKGVIDAATERKLSGEGRFKGGIDPQWMGHDPVDEYVVNALKEEGVTQTDIDAMNIRRTGGETWEDLEAHYPVLTPVLENNMNWPKPWRPVMRALQLGNEKLAPLSAEAMAGGGFPEADAASRVPTRPTALVQAGMEQPEYFSSAASELAQPWIARSAGERTNMGMAGFKGLSSEHMAVSNEFLPMSSRTLAEAVGNEAGRTAFNEHMFRALDKAKIPTIRDVLGPEQTQRVIDQANFEAKAQRLSVAGTKQLVGERLNNALLQAGHSPIIGDLNAPKPGAFDMGAAVEFSDVTADTPAVHTAVKTKLTQRYANKGGVPGAVLDWINKKFKGNVLPFSMRWQLGDAVGGAFMAWAGGGVNPAEFIGAMKQLKHLDNEAVEQMFNHPDFADASLSQGEYQVISQGPDAPTPKTPIGKFKNASFRLNNKINEVNRHAYVLAKTDKLLHEHGLSVDSLAGDKAAWAQPAVQKALTTAVDDAMNVMGSFDEMSPFEQRVMKRVFPFWAWNRHITALAWRTAIDNPARMMWTMRLGSYGSDPDSDLPSFLKGGIGLPGGLNIPTSSLNPFADVLGGEPIYTPAGAMRSTSPAFKIGAAALMGIDLNKGGAPITRPYGSGWVDENGRPKNTPLLARPLELAYQGAKTLPFSRVAMDQLPTMTIGNNRLGRVGLGPTGRLGSGAPLPQYTDPRIMRLLPLLGLPLTKKPEGK